MLRLLLLVLVYWFAMTYPWGFRIYARVVEGTLASTLEKASPHLIWHHPASDDIADAFEEQIKCSAANGTEWYVLDQAQP